MCSVCRMTPCRSGCPNAPEPKPVHRCDKCGFGIYEGDLYLDSPKGYVCEICIKDMSSMEMIELLGENLKTA